MLRGALIITFMLLEAVSMHMRVVTQSPFTSQIDANTMPVSSLPCSRDLCSYVTPSSCSCQALQTCRADREAAPSTTNQHSQISCPKGCCGT